MELVTEPVIDSAEKAGQFARELQLLLRTLGVSDANMEKGEMRVEANISVAKATETADERGLEARMDADRTKLLYEDITYKIRGAAFSVYNNLGSGHKESVYQNALEEELKNTGLSYEREKSIAVRYNGKEVGRYQPDFVIEGKILLELKALPFVGKKEKAQIKHYLEGSDYKLALLVNFGSHPIHIERIVYDIIRDNPPRSRISADNQRISAPLGVKVEVKNLNSFRSVERAILFEIERQSALLEEGGVVVQETRGWDETKQETFSQRIKEGSADYRYFPDPDLPSMLLSEIPECKYETIRSGLPELPWERRERYRSMKIADDDADMYVSNPTLGGFFEEVLDHLNGTEEQARLASNYIATDLVKLHRDIESRDTGYEGKIPISAKDFAKIITLVVEKKVSSRGAKDILALAVLEGGDPADIAEREGLFQKSSAKELGPIVANILSKHALVAEDYKKGNENALQFLVGQGMRATKGSADPIVLKKMFVDTIGAL
jgi:GxxExxY protein